MMKMRMIIAGVAVALIGCWCGGCNTGNDTRREETMKNAAIENILTRTSIRQYQPGRIVPADTLETLLRAAMAAPTAVNRQPWEFVVVDDRALLDSLMTVCPYARMLEHASLAIVTCGNMNRALEGEGRDFWIEDVSAATENLLLAAHALDLGAVWTGVYPSAERVSGIQKILNLPETIVPLALVPVGYPAVDPEPKDKWNPEKVKYNRWTESDKTV